jgi:hypothetical protein
MPAVCDLGAHSGQKPRPAQIKAASKIKIEVNSSTHTTTTRPYLAKSKQKDNNTTKAKIDFFIKNQIIFRVIYGVNLPFSLI